MQCVTCLDAIFYEGGSRAEGKKSGYARDTLPRSNVTSCVSHNPADAWTILQTSLQRKRLLSRQAKSRTCPSKRFDCMLGKIVALKQSPQ
jgi:hypothetical protein